jgi:orotate phosphoribosyltransferase
VSVPEPQPLTAPEGPLEGDAVLELFERTGALRRGHFRLSSGRHSDTYLQCALVLQWPNLARALGEAIAAPWRGRVDLVAGPALGGLIIGHEVAAALGTRFIFAERVGGAQALRRGFAVAPGDRVLLVEDVVTTGGSVLETARLLERAGATVAGLSAIVDRVPPDATRPGGLSTLVRVDAPAWDPGSCPRCAEGAPVDSPGSRRLGAGR